MCLISKKLFCTIKPIHKDWIHQNIVVKGFEYRLYDSVKYGCEQIFHNEIGYFFEYMVNQNFKIYYVKSSAKHNIIYTDECFEFFKMYKNNLKDIVMPENLKKLRELQCDDLMYFYENLILESFFIISKIKNNKYYYDMLIVVKNNFDINDFLNINFNVINIESIIPIFYENITYSYMQQLFNFEELDNYGFCTILDKDYNNFIYNFEYEQTQEYKNLRKYEQDQFESGNYDKMQQENSLYWFYSNECYGVHSELIDQKLMFKYYFLNFGWQWFSLNYNFEDMYKVENQNYTYPVNEAFALTTDGMVAPMAVVKPNGEFEEYTNQYESGCMFDLLLNLDNCNNYCVMSYNISIPKILYNTSYKCRLKKIDE